MVTCTICSKEFESFKELSKHLIKEHEFNAEELYKYYNYSFETGKATCPVCGKEFVMSKLQIKGFKKNPNKSIGCCISCSKSVIMLTHGSPLADPKVQQKIKDTVLERYGVEHIARSEGFIDKMKDALKEKYGVENAAQIKNVQEQKKATNLKKYGTEYPLQSEEVKEKVRKANLEKRGVENPFQSEEVKQKIKERNLEKYGVECNLLAEEVKQKIKATNLREYGVEYFCQHPKCYNATHNRISNVNKRFHKFLEDRGVKNELEFIVENLGYDLRAGDILIEIDPSFTHNSTVGPYFGRKRVAPKSSNYHLEKTNFAKEKGYNCIHVFDWEDWNKIMYLIQSRENIPVRNCKVFKIDVEEANYFTSLYHVQGICEGTQYAYGIFYEGELVEVMTFGKPRYNKNYEYELLRLCTAPKISIVRGYEKLLKFFEEQVKPESIISYCDLSKFNGEVYEKLGFELKKQTAPLKHLYNLKTKRHIFEKDDFNEELMKVEGYVEIYDCGQLVFVKKYE